MSIPAKDGTDSVFQLASVTLPSGAQAQAIVLVGADGNAIPAAPDTSAALQSIVAALGLQAAKTDAQPVSGAFFPATQPVSGTFWQATQPVSGSIDVDNFPADFPDTTALAKLELIRQLLASPLTVSHDAASAREATLQTVSGAVAVEDSPATPGAPGVAMLAVRVDGDASTAGDGDWTWLKMDEEGRLKCATKPASIPIVVGVANTVASTVICDVRRASNVVFHIKNIGSVTIAAGTFVWEGSIDSTNGTDGTWFGIQAVRSNANTIEATIALTGITAGAGYAASWEASVNGCNWMRIRCTVAVTASASAQWSLQRGSYATEPIPAAQASATQAVSGTVTITLPAPSAYSLTSAATTNAAFIKASAGSLLEATASNPTATPVFVKLYNKTTAPTVGTDVPVLTIPVPASSTVPLSFGAVGKRFTTGIAIAVTGAIAAADTTAAVAGVQIHASFI